MKKLLCILFSVLTATALFAVDPPTLEIPLNQRNSTNTGFDKRVIIPVASGLWAFNTSKVPESITLSAALDRVGSTRGSILYRGASGWAIFAPGAEGTVLGFHGAGADPTAVSVGTTAETLGGTSLNSSITAAPGLLSASVGTLRSMATQASNAVSISGGTITGATVTGLSAPSLSSDAATKAYVDSLSAGIVQRTGVARATTANITLSGEQTIDGVLTSATRILVKNQSTPAQNGIYVTAASSWSRATDSDTAGELLVGYLYFVSAGSTQAGSSWAIQSPAPTTLGTDAVTFAQFSASQTYSAGTGLGLAGNVFSLNASQTGLTLTSSAFNGTVGATTRSTGAFTTVNATGTVTGSNLSGTNTGDQTNITGNAATATNVAYSGLTGTVPTWNQNTTGNAATATALQTARTINGVSFNGTANITIPAATVSVFNVKDYGAAGNGSTNDTSAIATAKAAAVTAHGALYFPAGTYMTDTISVSSASGLTIYGDGMGVSIIKSRSPAQVLNVASSTRVNVHHLTFDGSCTTRTAGQQAVIFDASQSSFCDNETINSGEFANFFGASTAITDLIISRNLIRACYADGINLANVSRAVVSNNIIDGSDDDCIAAGYHGTSSFILITGNYCRARSDLGTTWGRGIAILGASDIIVLGNFIENTKQYGILLDSNGSGARPTRVQITFNTVKDAPTVSGNAVTLARTTDCFFSDNSVINPIAGDSCLELADWQNLTIQGGYLTQQRNQFCRGIHANESSGWAASWDGLKISRVSINMAGAATNSCIYLGPHSSVTMNTGIIDGVVGQQVAGGDYISVSYARSGTLWKIVNNTTATSGATINPGTGGVFTTTNNN